MQYKRMKYLLTAMGLTAFAGLVGQPAKAETWVFSGNRTILSVYPSDAGYYFYLSGSVLNGNSCSTQNNNTMVLSLNDANYYGKVSGLLAAFAEGRTVNVVYDADSYDCWTPINRLRVY